MQYHAKQCVVHEGSFWKRTVIVNAVGSSERPIVCRLVASSPPVIASFRAMPVVAGTLDPMKAST